MVTGASGFIGRHLCRRLLREPLALLRVSRKAEPSHILLEGGGVEDYQADLTDADSVRRLMKADPDVIFHLAGHGLIREGDDPILVTRANVLSTHNLLSHCKEGTRFVLASSAAVYGDTHPHVASDESQAPTPNSAYGASKASAECYVDTFTRAGRVRGVSLRLVANVGSHATHGILPDLMKKLFSPTETLDLLGDEPGADKPFVHVSDTAEAFVHFGLRLALNGKVNVANRHRLYVREVADIVMEAAGRKKPLKWGGATWRGDNPVVNVSTELATRLGWAASLNSARAVRQGTLDILAHWRHA